MENKIIVNRRVESIFAMISFAFLWGASLMVQFAKFKHLYLEVNLFIALSPLILAFVHEFLHYIGFLIFTNINIRDLYFKNSKGFSLPYVKTLQKLKRTQYICVLLCPTIVLFIVTFILILISNNILNTFIFATSFSISSGDILLAYKLLLIDKSKLVKLLNDELDIAIDNCLVGAE